jgi:hypothetical protein
MTVLFCLEFRFCVHNLIWMTLEGSVHCESYSWYLIQLFVPVIGYCNFMCAFSVELWVIWWNQ